MLTQLGRQLSATIAPDEVLPVVVRAVADALRLSYAAVTLDGQSRPGGRLRHRARRHRRSAAAARRPAGWAR
jgi:hypothetical protein